MQKIPRSVVTCELEETGKNKNRFGVVRFGFTGKKNLFLASVPIYENLPVYQSSIHCCFNVF